MYAQCPECLTFFRVRPEQLKAAQGQVRCSQCKQVFNALETLRGDLTTEELRAVREARKTADSAAEAPLLKEDSNGDLFANLDYTENEELPLETAESNDRESGATVPEHDGFGELPLTDFHRPRKRRHPLATLGLVIVNLLLLASLTAQWAHYQRRELLAHPESGPLLSQAYERIRFEVDPPRDLAAIRIDRSNVASHPEFDNTLLLTAVLENRAPVAQPWPNIRIDLEDRWGDTVGARYFTAREYLRDPALADELMPTGKTFALELAIRDPGSEAIGFQVEACLKKNERHVCVDDLSQ